MPERTLAVISAGLSQPSATRLLADRLADETVDALRSEGIAATVTTIDLRDHAHDILNALLTGFPVAALRASIDTVASADGLVAVTPLYTTTFSGLFKMFIDILDEDALAGTPVLLGATGGTPRHSLALEYAMRPLFTYLHANPVSTSVFAATDDWAGASGSLATRAARAGRELAAAMGQAAPKSVVDEFGAVPAFTDLLAKGLVPDDAGAGQSGWRVGGFGVSGPGASGSGAGGS